MKKILAVVFVVIIISGAGAVLAKRYFLPSSGSNLNPTVATSVRFVNSTITADGVVTAQNQAVMNFQTGGKLIYLPFKEGDKVTAGQIVARLDTYALQRQLTAALNNYRAARDTFDQTQSNSQTGVLQGSQKYSLQVTNKGGFNVDDVMGDIVKRILDQNQANLDNSVINVELANYAVQLATLTSPIDGIITRQGVNVSGVNITPATTFTITDPETMVFRANVATGNIYYVAEGSEVTLAVDGIPDKIKGIVVKVYPSKVTLPNGQSVYQVDIASEDLKKLGKLDETGKAIISTNSENVALVPAWTVLSGKYIWVDKSGTPQLREVKTGNTHNDEIEITGGLSAGDKIIVDPSYIQSLKYKSL